VLLGAHESITGGVDKAPERGRVDTCDCMQIFSKNQMQWKAKPLDLDEARRFKDNSDKFAIKETVIHDSYLINLCSPDKSLLKQSREAFLEETVRAKHLGARYLIFHPGAHMGKGEQAGMKSMAESLNWVRKEFGSGDVEFLLEITAGQGSVLGHSFDQLAKIISMLDDQKHAGVCFDTCHAYAAGYDVRTPKGYEATFEMFDEMIGLEKLKAFHLNDSKGKQGSRLDRHENIGKGFLGAECFTNLMNDGRFEKVPMILETPQKEAMYKKELKLLRSLIGKR
jgi:deoxyribonuclease-4